VIARRGSAKEVPPAPPPRRVNPAVLKLVERPVDMGLVGGSAAFVIAGLSWPQAADILLRLLVVSLALGWIANRAYRSLQHMQSRERYYSPFDDTLAEGAPPAAPRALRKLLSELRAADRPRARRATIPASALRTIRMEAAGRLNEHHGVSLSDPQHHERIRPMVSDAMWHIVRPDGVRLRPDGAAGPTSVPLTELDRILNELERL
jgi:hypothetical protein